jgi:hypothetical protein
VAPPPRPAAPSRAGIAWRDGLCAWARAAIGGSPGEALPAGTSPLSRLAARTDLSSAATRILHLLYAEWLAGRGDTGVAAQTLAEIAGDADGWSEALGTGRLAALGLVRADVGRCTLTRAVGSFLDGRDATLERIGVADPSPTAEGLFRVAAEDGEDARATAQRVAATLGQVAFVDDAAPLSVARLEAWLRELPLVTALDVAHLSPFDLRPREILLALVPAGHDDADGPPFWP